MIAKPIQTWMVVVAALAGLAPWLGLPARAGASVYWADTGGDAIGRANDDGTGADAAFILGAGDPCGVAVSSTHIYWANRAGGTIGRANLDGTEANQSFIAGASAPCGVAVSGSHVYWANAGPGATGSIGRANLDGTTPTQAFISLDGVPCGVAVSAERIYWAERSGELFSIGRANVDGSGAEEGFIPSNANPCGVAVSATHIHWANRSGGAIGRALLDGSGVEPQFIAGGSVSACGVAVTDAHVWWAISSTGAIGRANLDGTAPNPGFITGATAPCGVAVSASEQPPPEPGPASSPPSPFPDTDLDGLPGPFDRCPSVFGAGTADGCPWLGVRPTLTHEIGISPDRQRLRVVFKGKRQCPLPTQLQIVRVVGSADVGSGLDPARGETAFPDRLVASVIVGLGAYRVPATVRPGTFYAFRAAAFDSASGRCPALRSRLREVRAAPVFARSELVEVLTGVVRVRPRGTRRFVRLREATLIPDGSEFDTGRGSVRITVARRDGSTESADVSEGRAIVDQDRAARPTTTLKLSERLACPRATRTTAAAKRKRMRKLFVKTDGGRFRTRGRHAAVTARRTAWRTTDSCKTTRIDVRKGAVSVRDLVARRTIRVRAPKFYVARSARR